MMSLMHLFLALVGLFGFMLAPSVAEAPVAAGRAAPTPQLTDAERAYIARRGPVTMCVDPDWEPFERITAEGRHEGIAADLVQLVAQRVGLTIVLHRTRSWDESLASSRAKECEILSFLNDTPARRAWLAFTAPIFSDPNIIVTRDEHPYVGDLHGIVGEIVALPRGTMVEERIRVLYPQLGIVTTDSEQAAVELVSGGEADMTIRSLVVAAFSIRKEGLFNLKISGQVPELSNQLSIGVAKDETTLRTILDKGVATLTAQDRETISNRHVSVLIQRDPDYTLVAAVTLGAGILLLLAYLWNRKLRRLNAELSRMSVTDPLTGLFNRMRTDEILDAEVRRAARTGSEFSVLMIDVDRFKSVNDVHGHQAGDGVLRRLGDGMRTRIRSTDSAGRWGGEEFIVVCPATGEAGAAVLAEKLRATFANEDHPTVGRATISIGVATWRSGERAEDVVGRADAALYQAKREGRNRVCIAPPSAKASGLAIGIGGSAPSTA
jgi:diguanylate cyclase (GGDEF)-like protein